MKLVIICASSVVGYVLYKVIKKKRYDKEFSKLLLELPCDIKADLVINKNKCDEIMSDLLSFVSQTSPLPSIPSTPPNSLSSDFTFVEELKVSPFSS